MRGIRTESGLNEADGYVMGATLSSYAKAGTSGCTGWNICKPTMIIGVRPSLRHSLRREGGFYYNFLSDAKKVVFLYAGAVSPCRI